MSQCPLCCPLFSFYPAFLSSFLHFQRMSQCVSCSFPLFSFILHFQRMSQCPLCVLALCFLYPVSVSALRSLALFHCFLLSCIFRGCPSVRSAVSCSFPLFSFILHFQRMSLALFHCFLLSCIFRGCPSVRSAVSCSFPLFSFILHFQRMSQCPLCCLLLFSIVFFYPAFSEDVPVSALRSLALFHCFLLSCIFRGCPSVRSAVSCSFPLFSFILHFQRMSQCPLCCLLLFSIVFFYPAFSEDVPVSALLSLALFHCFLLSCIFRGCPSVRSAVSCSFPLFSFILHFQRMSQCPLCCLLHFSFPLFSFILHFQRMSQCFCHCSFPFFYPAFSEDVPVSALRSLALFHCFLLSCIFRGCPSVRSAVSCSFPLFFLSCIFRGCPSVRSAVSCSFPLFSFILHFQRMSQCPLCCLLLFSIVFFYPAFSEDVPVSALRSLALFHCFLLSCIFRGCPSVRSAVSLMSQCPLCGPCSFPLFSFILHFQRMSQCPLSVSCSFPLFSFYPAFSEDVQCPLCGLLLFSIVFFYPAFSEDVPVSALRSLALFHCFLLSCIFRGCPSVSVSCSFPLFSFILHFQRMSQCPLCGLLLFSIVFFYPAFSEDVPVSALRSLALFPPLSALAYSRVNGTLIL
ncbi:hypothetical protein CDAR_389121 [Caerostris darwini]|uniref:Uncharacterized protein n=1 Tax=Caerostris darwini TaxID=1538125 RepID=A0AAV4T6X1_9ARAC|nr:hypothetical protein CDAR_389121 [Caerostris darwini]